MTDQPETARHLLDRYGLPEDVIDGALCLHAQEMSIRIRTTDFPNWFGSLDQFENGAGWAADLIDQAVPAGLAGTANAEQHRAAAPVPVLPPADRAAECPRCRHDDRTRGVLQLSALELYPPDHAPDCRAALRDRIVAAIKASPFEELRAVDHAPNGPLQITVKVDDLADALLRRLPAPADRAAVLREAADRFERECPDAGGSMGLCMCHAAEPLREWAAEAQQDGAQNRG